MNPRRTVIAAPISVPRTGPQTAAFTLIELSIVLVVIGLIVGGILTGQSLIRQAQIQSISTDINKFTTAIVTFEDKYNALPGDMPNATSYWGTNPNCATGGAGSGTQTCNGNGNGLIEIQPPGAGANMEQFLAWQHLSNAGLIAGQFSGGGPNYYQCVTNVNCPSGKAGQAYFVTTWILGIGYYPSGDGGWWYLPQDNYLMVGFAQADYTWGPFLTPAEALAFDLKVDDGKPGTGTWVSSPPAYTSTCAIDTATNAVPDGSVSSEGTSIYNLSIKGPACALTVNLHL